MTAEAATFPPSSVPSVPVVLVSWDGKSSPLGLIHQDARPEFVWLLFDYSGTHQAGSCELHGQTVELLSAATECKGEIYTRLADHLVSRPNVPEYVALIDDDIVLSVSQINWALFLGRSAALDAFSPTLHHDSSFSHSWTLTQGNRLYREVDWVEVMMPFYRGELFLAGREHYRGNISSWGVDCFLIPMLQQLLRCTRTALLDAVAAGHRRPVSSGGRIFRNGRTAQQEMEAMRQYCIQYIDEHAPQLRGTDWFQRILMDQFRPTLRGRLKRRLQALLGAKG